MSEFYYEGDFDRDEYGALINGEGTYQELAKSLWDMRAVVFAWTDGETQLDILMAFGAEQESELSGGMNAGTDLFVAVRNLGMFGFELNGQYKHPTYVAEKLDLTRGNPIAKPLAQLINGVAAEILK